MISEFAAIVIVSVAVMILWQYRQWRYSPLFRIPGPKCNVSLDDPIIITHHHRPHNADDFLHLCVALHIIISPPLYRRKVYISRVDRRGVSNIAT